MKMTTPDPVTILPEPTIEFGLRQRLHDPHDGLALFGPFDAASGAHPKSVTYAVVGTAQGLSAFVEWCQMMRGAAVPDPLRDQVGRRPLNQKLWPPYPGFEAAFLSTWPESPVWAKELDRAELLRCASEADPNKRAFDVVNAYLNVIETALKRDARPAVIVCVVPEEVWLNCRPESRVVGAVGERITPSEPICAARRTDEPLRVLRSRTVSPLGGLPTPVEGPRHEARRSDSDHQRNDAEAQPAHQGEPATPDAASRPSVEKCLPTAR